MDNVARNRPGKTTNNYSCPIRCCIFSFTVWYAFIIVCSLITISVVSGRGRLTREAIAAASVSTMILGSRIVSYRACQLLMRVKSKWAAHPSSIVSSRQSSTKSKFSSTPRFSSEFRRSIVSASVSDPSAVESISSFSVGPAMKYRIRSSECLYTAR